MHAWEAIQKVVDHIEDHLPEELSIEELARIAALSPFYFQRLFSRLVQCPVREYIRLRRLAQATQLLKQTDSRILDIALDCGFQSHETFTRAFKSAHGMTPEEYRQNPIWLNQFQKPELLLGYVLVDENVPLIADGIVLEIRRERLDIPQHFLGWSMQVPSVQSAFANITGPNPMAVLWDRLHTEKSGFPGLVENGYEIGITGMGRKKGHFTYFAGAQVDRCKEAGGWENWTIQPDEYVICAFEAETPQALVDDALAKGLNYLFGMWLPQYGLITEPWSLERYESTGPQAKRMEVWVKTISKPDME